MEKAYSPVARGMHLARVIHERGEIELPHTVSFLLIQDHFLSIFSGRQVIDCITGLYIMSAVL
jgi:hypothetical protein